MHLMTVRVSLHNQQMTPPIHSRQEAIIMDDWQDDDEFWQVTCVMRMFYTCSSLRLRPSTL